VLPKGYEGLSSKVVGGDDVIVHEGEADDSIPFPTLLPAHRTDTEKTSVSVLFDTHCKKSQSKAAVDNGDEEPNLVGVGNFRSPWHSAMQPLFQIGFRHGLLYSVRASMCTCIYDI
jgi:hypothetical protein